MGGRDHLQHDFGDDRRRARPDRGGGCAGPDNATHHRATAAGRGRGEDDPAVLAGLWNWDVIFRSTAGDLRLEVGYEEPGAVDAAVWLADHPDALVSW